MSKHYRLVALAVVLAVICAAAWFVIDMRQFNERMQEADRVSRNRRMHEKAQREAEQYEQQRVAAELHFQEVQARKQREEEFKAKPWLKLLPEKTP